MKRIPQPSKSSVRSPFKKVNKNKVECKLCDFKIAFHKSTRPSHLRTKHLAESRALSAELQSIASFVTQVAGLIINVF